MEANETTEDELAIKEAWEVATIEVLCTKSGNNKSRIGTSSN